jgi:hypothetical protein
MKSHSTRNFIAGPIVSIMAFAALNTAARAESLEDRCRAAARAELKGPDCRMSVPTSACNMPSQTDVPTFDNKTVECVKRGGPGRQSKT